MKKILYLTMAPIDESSGVYKKILSQVVSFINYGYDCRVLFVRDSPNSYLRLCDGKISKINLDNPSALLTIKNFIKECDFCYARFELLRHSYYRMIIRMCMKQSVRIVLEIPTYPPSQESIARAKEYWKRKHYFRALKTLFGTFFVVMDMYIMTVCSKVVILIADDKKFLFTKTLRLENGINLDTNIYQPKKKNETIRIIAVSNFSIWNGYDRAISGLKNYIEQTGKHDIRLIMVGDKSAGESLINQATELGILNDIEFTGALSGETLNEAYAKSDIALGALGNHRRKVFANSSLKAKEYSARGMLMILSDAEGIEDEILKRSYIVKSDETPLDLFAIKNWFCSLEDITKTRKFIRDFAMIHYSWDSQIDKLLSNI